MDKRIQHIGPEVVALCRQHHIRSLSVFGSAARGEMNAESDIDLLVEFEPTHAPSLAGFARLKQSFATLLQVPSVDLATSGILRNPYRRKAILADLKQLYAA
jgi:predicted nucleotidyltransferase